MYIRRATKEDIVDTFTWRNDWRVRKWCLNTDEIDFDKHRTWFLQKLTDPDCVLYIAQIGTDKVGQVRFDIDSNIATINTNLNPAYFGYSYGTPMINLATELLFQELPYITEVKAEILPTNIASQRAFEKSNYTLKLYTYRRKHGNHS